jgi:hypothetical protein
MAAPGSHPTDNGIINWESKRANRVIRLWQPSGEAMSPVIVCGAAKINPCYSRGRRSSAGGSGANTLCGSV